MAYGEYALSLRHCAIFMRFCVVWCSSTDHLLETDYRITTMDRVSSECQSALVGDRKLITLRPNLARRNPIMVYYCFFSNQCKVRSQTMNLTRVVMACLLFGWIIGRSHCALGDSLSLGDTVNVGYVSYGAPYSIDNNGDDEANVGAGLFTLQARSPDNTANVSYSNVVQATANSGTIASFCIDLKEFIWPYTSPNLFQVVPLADAPNYSTDNGGTIGEMGAFKAQEIEQLWAHFINPDADAYVDPNNTDQINAGFQLAVWEIEYETSSTLDLTAGSFLALTGINDPQVTGAIDEANSMLAWLAANHRAPMANLVALSAPSGTLTVAYQDQVIELDGSPRLIPTPEPTNVVSLITLSIAAVIFGAWKTRGHFRPFASPSR